MPGSEIPACVLNARTPAITFHRLCLHVSVPLPLLVEYRAMMRQMRENTKWIMLVTALAFVARARRVVTRRRAAGSR